jgi:ATP synthase protein I
MPKFKKEYVRLLVALSSLGIEMAASIIIGYFIGRHLDKLFDTGNILTTIFVLFGMVAGFRSLFRISKKVQKDLLEHKLDDIYDEENNSGKGE